MCNMSWTPHCSLEKDNTLNHCRVRPKCAVVIRIKILYELRTTHMDET